MSMSISSPAFAHMGLIPRVNTCDGDDLSPQLSWSGVPASAASLTLIIDDPDAPDPAQPKTTWVHWVLYNIQPDTPGLDAAVAPSGLPPGTLEGINDWKRTGYGGPCPPIGQHRYFFKLFALDCVLADLKRPAKAELEKAMGGHVIERTELVGLYRRVSI